MISPFSWDATTERPWLFITFGSTAGSLGGTQVRASAITRALKKMGADCEVVMVGAGNHGRQPGVIGAGGLLEGLVKSAKRLRQCKGVILGSAQFFPVAVAARLFSKPVIWDAGPCEYLGNRDAARAGHDPTRRTLYSLVWFVIEALTGKLSSRVIVTSSRDLNEWRTVYPFFADRLRTVLHIGSLEAQNGDQNIEELEELRNHAASKKFLLFVGNVEAKHNAAAATIMLRDAAFLKVLEDQGCTLVLVGRGTDNLRDLPPGVIALGTVERIGPLIRNAVACVSPQPYSNGTLTKIIDYLRFGRGIICSPQSLRGIDIRAEWPVVVAEPSQLAEGISRYFASTFSSHAATDMNRSADVTYSEESFFDAFATVVDAG